MHDDAVEAEGQAAVRGGAVLERVQEEAELVALLLLVDAEELEDAGLLLRGMDTDGAAAEFAAVEHEVVGEAGDRGDPVAVAGGEGLLAAVGGGGEGVVQRVPAACFPGGCAARHRVPVGDRRLEVARLLQPLHQRKVDHPDPGVLVQVDQVQVVGELDPQLAEHAVDDRGLRVHAEAQQIARFGLGGLDQLRADALQELGDAGGELKFSVGLLHLAHRQPAAAEAFGELRQRVGLLAGERAAAGHADQLHGAPGSHGRVEDLEAGVAADLGHVHQFHAEAEVGPVGAEAGHRLRVGHPRNLRHVDTGDLFPDAADHPLAQRDHVLLVDEAHLQVDLGELRLPVSPRVLVAEAADDLHVPLGPADHQELLEQLRALGQGVEAAGLQAAGDQKVPRTFRGGAAQGRASRSPGSRACRRSRGRSW